MHRHFLGEKCAKVTNKMKNLQNTQNKDIKKIKGSITQKFKEEKETES